MGQMIHEQRRSYLETRTRTPLDGIKIDGIKIDDVLRVAALANDADVLDATTRALTSLLGERGVCVWLEGGARVVSAPHAPWKVERRVDLARFPEIELATKQQGCLVIADAQSDELLAPVRGLLPPTLRTLVAVPVIADNRPIAVFLIQSNIVQRIPAQARATAEALARVNAVVFRTRLGADARGRQAPVSAARRHFVPVPAFPPTPRVLVVEDDPDQAVAMVETLSEEGFLVESAADAVKALTMVTDQAYDLLVLDVDLPRLDGFAAAIQLRALMDSQIVPVLFVSAISNLSRRVHNAGLANVDFLPKPFGRDDLLARVHSRLCEAHARRSLSHQAEHDDLTGLANTRALSQAIARERARFDRYGIPCSLVVLDMDRLKRINDERGHATGSRAIQAVAAVLRAEARDTDVTTRYGGDEFVVLLPNTTLEQTLTFAERLRSRVAALTVEGFGLTVSLGAATMKSGAAGPTNSEDTFERADAEVYRAKRLGGNRVCC